MFLIRCVAYYKPCQVTGNRPWLCCAKTTGLNLISYLKSIIKIIKILGLKNSKESLTAPTDTGAGHLHRLSTAVFVSPLVTFVLHVHTPSSSRISHRRQSQERENVLLLWTPSAGAWQSQGFLQEQSCSFRGVRALLVNGRCSLSWPCPASPSLMSLALLMSPWLPINLPEVSPPQMVISPALG